MRTAAATLTIALLLAMAGCGGDEEDAATVIPAAGDYAQTTTEDGPSGGLTAGDWLELPADERSEAVAEYLAAEEDVCGDADPDRVEDYVEVSAGSDYPLTAPVGELFAEGCAAVLQS